MMRKYLYLLLCIFAIFGISSCGEKKEEEINEPTQNEELLEEQYIGTYKLYSMTGSLSLSDYEYYRITLKADGICEIESKSPYSSQAYSATATYEIKKEEVLDLNEGTYIEKYRIYIYTKTGEATITEVYDYVNGEIHMLNQNIGGYRFSAKFKR